MNTSKKIKTAFILNLSFSIFEFIGGIFTGSTLITSDAFHDAGDALGIGLSYFLEKKSTKKPDEKYPSGYGRFSVLGAVIASALLIFGAAFMIYNAVHRIIRPVEIDYGAMTVLAVIGVAVNLCAALVTRSGSSLNQRAVNLHMLEDVITWTVTLVGAVVMRVTELNVLDPIISVGVSLFILKEAYEGLREAAELLLERAPRGVDVGKLRSNIAALDGVTAVKELRVWSMDGENHFAAVHIECNTLDVKTAVKGELERHKISHATVELDFTNCR